MHAPQIITTTPLRTSLQLSRPGVKAIMHNTHMSHINAPSIHSSTEFVAQKKGLHTMHVGQKVVFAVPGWSKAT